jgi:hypothetical protein
VGIEASGHARWFKPLLAELQFQLWVGDAAEIQSKRVCERNGALSEGMQSCAQKVVDTAGIVRDFSPIETIGLRKNMDENL